MRELTGFQRDLLFVLGGMDAPSGREIKQELEGSLGCDILHGRLYSNLDLLVDEGLAEKGTIDGRTNCYELTDEGLAELRDRYEWQREYLISAGLGPEELAMPAP